MKPEIAGAAKHRSRASSAAPSHERWTVRRKAAIVKAVGGGRVSLDEVCRTYKLSIEEFLTWERDMDRYGVPVCAPPDTKSIVRPTRERPARDGLSQQTYATTRLINVGPQWHCGDLAAASVGRRRT